MTRKLALLFFVLTANANLAMHTRGRESDYHDVLESWSALSSKSSELIRGRVRELEHHLNELTAEVDISADCQWAVTQALQAANNSRTSALQSECPNLSCFHDNITVS